MNTISIYKEMTLHQLITVFLLVVFSLLLIHFFIGDRLWDDKYIIYRYSQNLSEGKGWSFNPGIPINGSTTTLYTLLLAILGFLKFDIPTMGYLLSLLFLGICGLASYWLLKSNGYLIARFLVVPLILFHPVLIQFLGIESTLYLTFCILSIYFFLQNRIYLTSLFLSLTVLTRPDGILLAITIYLWYLLKYKRIPLIGILIFISLLFPWWIYSYIHFSTIFPSTLYAKIVQGELTGDPLWIQFLSRIQCPMPMKFVKPLWLRDFSLTVYQYVLLLGLFILWVGDKEKKISNQNRDLIGLIILWIILHISTYIYFSTSIAYLWHMIPVVWGYCILIAVILEKIYYLFKYVNGKIIVTVLFLCIFLPTLKYDYDLSRKLTDYQQRAILYREAGEWLNLNTPPNAKIGISEVGVLGYFSNRNIIDAMGLVTPDVSLFRELRDDKWFIRFYQPDYFLIFDPPLYEIDIQVNEPWWDKAYMEVKEFIYPKSTLRMVLYRKINNSNIPSPFLYGRPLIDAVDKENLKLVKRIVNQYDLVNAKNKDGNTPLMIAVFKGNKKIVSYLLSHGADCNLVNKEGGTALMGACQEGHTGIVKLLLQNDANVNAKTREGWNPLIAAAHNDNSDIVKLLLENGAEVDIQNHDGNTPLLTASWEGHTATVKVLLSYGADPLRKNKDGGTPILAAHFQNHKGIIELLNNKRLALLRN